MRARRRVAALALAVAVASSACGDDPAESYAGIVREPAPVVAGVSLPDATTGAPVAFRAEPGGVLLVYFGYLTCPDVCPTTMADIRTALTKLPSGSRELIDVRMVTIDPGRDTAAALEAYVDSFVDGAALRTEDPSALRAAADAFGADYRVTTAPDGGVEVSHTAFLYAVDDQGRLRLTWPFGVTAADIARDLTRLLSRVDHAA